MKNMNPRLRLGSIFFTLSSDFFLHILKSYSDIVQYLLGRKFGPASMLRTLTLEYLDWGWIREALNPPSTKSAITPLFSEQIEKFQRATCPQTCHEVS